MTQVVVAALMWLLTAALAVTARRRRSQQVLLASVFISLSMTLNVDSLYLFADRVVGGRNSVTLLADLCLVGGVYLLSASIISAVQETTRRFLWSWSAVGLVVAVAAMVLSFPLIVSQGSTTRFMADLGGQPAAAVYNSAQYVYISAVMAHAGVVVARNIRFMRSRGYEIGYWSVAVGCAVALLLGVDVIGMNLSHVLGAAGSLRSLQSVYDVLFIVAMVFLCGGLATVAASGFLRAVRRKRRGEQLNQDVHKIWQRYVRTPAIPQPTADDPEMHLYRMLVEIRDAQLAAGQERLTVQEMDTVRRAEEHLTVSASLRFEENE